MHCCSFSALQRGCTAGLGPWAMLGLLSRRLTCPIRLAASWALLHALDMQPPTTCSAPLWPLLMLAAEGWRQDRVCGHCHARHRRHKWVAWSACLRARTAALCLTARHKVFGTPSAWLHHCQRPSGDPPIPLLRPYKRLTHWTHCAPLLPCRMASTPGGARTTDVSREGMPQTRHGRGTPGGCSAAW